MGKLDALPIFDLWDRREVKAGLKDICVKTYMPTFFDLGI